MATPETPDTLAARVPMPKIRRVRVTGPRRGVRRPHPSSRAGDSGGDGAEQTEPDAVHVRSLMRAQLRLALVTCGVVGLVLGALPLVFALAPLLSKVRVCGVPLSWLVLCLGVQPLWVVAAIRHVRHVERTEREFIDLVTRS